MESLILPAVAAVACVGAIRLVPFGLGLAPALLITGLLVERCLALEARILASPAELDAEGAHGRARHDARSSRSSGSSASPR